MTARSPLIDPAPPAPARLNSETAGAIALVGATVVALVWANSPWPEAYTSLWRWTVDLGGGRLSLHLDLHHLVNDGLMAIFFFVVGLEIKRELVVGDLRDPRTAALPAMAAAGGMIMPAVIFVAINAAGGHSAGWAVPIATDVAFAVGIVAVFGTRLPSSVRLFLLALAIVDDIGAIVVIAVFYSTAVDLRLVGAGAGVIVALIVLRKLGMTSVIASLPFALVLWVLIYKSGVHATIAGVALGVLTPARPDPGSTESVAERLEHRIQPFSTWVIVPLFALANAGVRIDLASLSRPGPRAIALGVVAGLLVGKTVGVSLFTWTAVRLGWGRLPDAMSWPHVIGVAMVAGVGFTVSLFVADLAFTDQGLVDAAKAGVLVGSLLAGIGGAVMLGRLASAGNDLTSPPVPTLGN